MRLGLAVFVMVASVALVCCSSVNGEDATEPVAGNQTACVVADRILVGPSAFEVALDQWSRAPLGSKDALAALDDACTKDAEDDTRGTENAACTLLGLSYSAGEGVPKDQRLAFEYFARGAKCSFSFDAMDLSQDKYHAIFGSSVGCCGGVSCPAGCEALCARASAAVTVAIEAPLNRACNAGRSVGCFMLAELERGQYLQRIGYVKTSTPHDFPALLVRACDRGLGIACARASYATPHALGTEPDLTLLKRACDLGWPDACFHLGQKKDAANDRAHAVPYWERACELGMPRVCTDLSEILSKGDGVPVDHEGAATAFANALK